MATEAAAPSTPQPADNRAGTGLATWGRLPPLSSVHRTIEGFLAARPFERAPWLAVAFALGIAGWVVLPGPWDWGALFALCGAAIAGGLLLPASGDLPHLRQALLAVPLMIAAGCATIWIKSDLVGTPGIARPMLAQVEGIVLDRQDEGARDRVRLLLDAAVAGQPRAIRVRVNLDPTAVPAGLAEGAQVRLTARLMPPAPPMLPGGYDFARAAWFQGLAATGRAVGPVVLLRAAPEGGSLRRIQQQLADHVRARLAGSPGTIAAALVSGDRGAIAPADEEAMRDAGLTHLLSISGLHVSAVVGAVYLLSLRLLALIPWLALRVRLPLLAALLGALAGVGYTLLTGAEVPTVRSVIGALLVLAALALGRDPLSLRMLAAAALFVMVFWPEAVIGPSFQMSFASVIAIVSLHGAAPIRTFLSRHEEEGLLLRLARRAFMLLVTGVVIELALMPIALFHFHRAGLFGALANVVAIPLTTFVTMPLEGLALMLDMAGWGPPAWWLAGKSLELLLALAHLTASLPGAVTMMPAMPGWVFGLFVGGLLWLAMWSGRVQLAGLVPVGLALVAFALQRVPDILVSSDGRHVGIAHAGRDLIVLREVRADFTRQSLLEAAGMDGEVRAIDDWPGARCNEEFCSVVLSRGGRRFVLLLARGQGLADSLALAAACERADAVVAERRLPAGCRPRLIKADRMLLAQTGGLAIDLVAGRVRTVAETQGDHGWWRPAEVELSKRPRRRAVPDRPSATASDSD